MSPVDEHVDQILLSPAEALAAVRADEQQGALLSLALRHLEATNAYADDGTVSMSAWLRNHARMSSKDATSLLSTGRYLDSNPAFAEAAITGRLSAGQVGIAKQLGHPKYSALLSDLQEELAEILAPLSYADTQVAVAKWRNDADAVLDDGDGTPRHLPNISISADITTLTTNAPRATNDERRTTNDDRRQTNDDTGRPVTPACTETYLCDCKIHIIVRDADGAPETFGRTTYSIPRSLFRQVAARDSGCRFPGCNRPVRWTDGHHIHHWEHGGPTDYCNLVNSQYNLTAARCSTVAKALRHIPGFGHSVAPGRAEPLTVLLVLDHLTGPHFRRGRRLKTLVGWLAGVP